MLQDALLRFRRITLGTGRRHARMHEEQAPRLIGSDYMSKMWPLEGLDVDAAIRIEHRAEHQRTDGPTTLSTMIS